MDKNRIVGAAHRVKGAVKETVGRVTGDAKTQAEDGLLQLHRRLVQPGAAALSPRLPLANGL